MFHGLSFVGEINPWAAPARRPWRSRGFLRSGAALLSGATTAAPAPPPVMTLISFTTDGLAVRLARAMLISQWAGSATAQLFIRSRGAILGEYSTQFTHDTEQFVAIALDVLCPPHSQIEISMLNLTDSGNDRAQALYVSGWYEPGQEGPQ